MNEYALYIHGNYFVRRGDEISEGQIIGTSNGNYNFIPHNHISIFRGKFINENKIGNKVKHFYNEKPWIVLDPLNYITGGKDIPSKSYLLPGGYKLHQKTPYSWYLGPNSSLHDGIDFSSQGKVGEQIYSIINGIVVDTLKDSSATYLLIKIKNKMPSKNLTTNKKEEKKITMKLNYNKRYLVRFIGIGDSFLNTYADNLCSQRNETLKIFNNQEYYITEDEISGNYILELDILFLVFIKKEAIRSYIQYV